MAQVNIANGWRILSDFDIETYPPDPDPNLPAPLSQASRAYKTGAFAFMVAGSEVGFGYFADGHERYVVINCEKASGMYIKLISTSHPIPKYEYEPVVEVPMMVFNRGAEEVEIDFVNKMFIIRCSKQ